MKKIIYPWLYLIFFYTTTTFAENLPANNVLTKLEDFELAQIPEKTGAGFNRATAFSNNNQLFALFQLYENNLGTIRIWDTKTGQLRYKTVINNYHDAAEGGSGLLKLNFSPKDETLIITGMVGASIITWSFTKDTQVQQSCESYMGVEQLNLSPDSKTYLAYSIDNEISLCQMDKNQAILNYKNWLPEEWWGVNTQILVNDKLLTIYNYRTDSIPAHPTKTQPNQAILESLDLWDINFTSKSNKLLAYTDQASQSFFLIESFSDKTIINQWNYITRKLINNTTFKDIKTQSLYISDKYLLLHADYKFSLIQRNKNNLNLIWSKDLSSIYKNLSQLNKEYTNPYEIKFSANNRLIIFYNKNYQRFNKTKPLSPVVLVDTKNAEINAYPALEIKNRILVDSQANYFLKDPYLLCSEKKTTLYNLSNHQQNLEINGEVLAISSNGSVLATCLQQTLSLKHLNRPLAKVKGSSLY